MMAAGSRADLLKKTIREGHSVRARARARSGRLGVRHVVEHRTLNHRGTCREHLRTVRCYPPPLTPPHSSPPSRAYARRVYSR